VGASFEVVRRLAETVAGATERSAFPLVLSGNCMSIGRAEVGIVPPAAGAERAGPALDRLRTQVGSVYLHVDLDVLDPTAGRANEYAAPGGLSAEDVEGIVEAVGDRFEVLGPAVTAYDPGADPEARVPALAADIMRRIAATAAANVEAAPR
jgi:arginase